LDLKNQDYPHVIWQDPSSKDSAKFDSALINIRFRSQLEDFYFKTFGIVFGIVLNTIWNCIWNYIEQPNTIWYLELYGIEYHYVLNSNVMAMCI
ncbi:hypothetical protein GJ496_010123, partial [Pomphorhynchus laevis]